MSVAYLGPEGTFSGIVAGKRFGTKTTLLAQPTIEAVFDAVSSGAARLGLVPVENSSGGTVHDTIDLLIRHAGSIFVHEEVSLNVGIALLARDARPATTVFSHFTQIKHHSEWLKKRCPSARLVTVESTAVAAQRAARTRGGAALASPGAAKLYGLRVIARPAREVNVTNFFVIGRDPGRSGGDRTALVAALRNECGSLHRFLGPFARGRVSLTRIISRPVPGQPQTYVFYIEIEGGPGESPVAAALNKARGIARTLTPLGTFPVGRRFRS